MKGGAIPLLAWGGLLVVLLAINWIWTGNAIQVGSLGFAVVVVLGSVGSLALKNREALRRGAPDPQIEPEAVPQGSLGAALAGFSVATFMFGFVFGTFLIFFGAGLFVASLGRLVVELRAQRRTRAGVSPEQ